MLKIKGEELIHSNFSFILPQGFNLITDHEISEIENLLFVSDDKNTTIKITFTRSQKSEKEDFTDLCSDCEFIPLGRPFEVRRGAGTATALYYRQDDCSSFYYEEQYSFEGNGVNRISIYIEHSVKSGLSLEKILNQPEVKAFWNGIEYF